MNVSGISGSWQPDAVSGASLRAPPQHKMSQLFDKIDTAGTGSISQDQFQQAFQTLKPPAKVQAVGADAIWSQLDPNGTGVVSKQDFASTMAGLIRSQYQNLRSTPADAAGTADAATQALDGLGPAAGGRVNLLS